MPRNKKDYAAMLRELRPYVRGFDARDGFKLDAKRLSAGKKAAISKWHRELKNTLLDPHVIYRDRDRAKLDAVKRATGMANADRFKVAIVKTPMPERTKVSVRKRGKTVKVDVKLAAPRAPGRRKRKPVALALESRDWQPERLLLDPEGEVRRITRGDGPNTKYVFKAGQFVQWRMGFPVGPEMLLRQVVEIASEYGVKSLREWATGVWAFRGNQEQFKQIIRSMRETREDMAKVRRRAKRMSKRGRATGRR